MLFSSNFVNFLINWKTFNELCKTNNIKLFFSTWSNTDIENLLKINIFSNLVNVNPGKDGVEKMTVDYYKDHEPKSNDVFKRDGHSGRIFHNFWH